MTGPAQYFNYMIISYIESFYLFHVKNRHVKKVLLLSPPTIPANESINQLSWTDQSFRGFSVASERCSRKLVYNYFKFVLCFIYDILLTHKDSNGS